MTLPNPTPGDPIAAADIDSLVAHLQGGSGKTDAYHFRQSSGSLLVTLPDAAGATKFRINDSADAEVFSVNSDGTISNAGTYAPGAFTIPGSASPSPTTDGSMVWDTDDNNIAIGDGASTQLFFSDNKGSDLASASTLTTTGHYHHVTGTTTVTGIATRPSGVEVLLYFTGAAPLTHNATSFILKEARSRTTIPGESTRFVSEGSGNWREVGTQAAGPYVQKANQTVTSSTTLVSSTYLTCAVEASSYYNFEAKLLFTSNGTADVKFGLLGPSGAGGYYNAIGDLVGAGQVTPATDSDLSSASTSSFDGSSGNDMAQLTGIIVTGVTAGSVTIQFAQNTSDASNTSLLIGSTLVITKVA